MQGATGESGIRVSGHTLVLDIFSRGAVMLEAEVKEFFDVESLTPATDRCAPTSASRIDRQFPNIQDYFLGLSQRKFRDCGKYWHRPHAPQSVQCSAVLLGTQIDSQFPD